MEDRELLEMAAKAAGYNIRHLRGALGYFLSIDGMSRWNPIADDGDALRLAAQLGIGLEVNDQDEVITAWWNSGTLGVTQSQDIGTLAAMRLAITKAAAAIGQTLP